MADYDNTNTFVLFKNDKGSNPKRPDYAGTANVDGIGFVKVLVVNLLADLCR